MKNEADRNIGSVDVTFQRVCAVEIQPQTRDQRHVIIPYHGRPLHRPCRTFASSVVRLNSLSSKIVNLGRNLPGKGWAKEEVSSFLILFFCVKTKLLSVKLCVLVYRVGKYRTV